MKFSPIKVSSTRDVARQSVRVITENDQWTKFLSESLGFAGTAPGVDFRSHQVVAIFAGQKPTAGYSVQVQKVSDDSQPGQPSRGTVHYRIIAPPPDAFLAQVLTYPFVLIRVEKRFAMLEFDPPLPLGADSNPRP